MPSSPDLFPIALHHAFAIFCNSHWLHTRPPSFPAFPSFCLTRSKLPPPRRLSNRGTAKPSEQGKSEGRRHYTQQQHPTPRACPFSARKICLPAMLHACLFFSPQALPPSLPPSPLQASRSSTRSSPLPPIPVYERSAQQQQHTPTNPLPPPPTPTPKHNKNGKAPLLHPPHSPPQPPPPGQCLGPVNRCAARREQHDHPEFGASAGKADEGEGEREGREKGRERRIDDCRWVGAWNSSDHIALLREREKGRVGIITPGNEASNDIWFVELG